MNTSKQTPVQRGHLTITSAAGKIRVLPPDVVGRIAAGEVIERPAAVVKELIDNSLDAGSSRIVVEVAEGGRALIRVTDDGEGMDRTDAMLAFERHATSKLQSDKDLTVIRTLGFRGEALPSIAAVSHVRLLTVQRNAAVGTELVLAGGAVSSLADAAGAPGTQVEVSNLFFNTPARKKFLKSPSTEFAHISQAVQQSALCWPGVGFAFRHNGQPVCDYPAVSNHRDRLFQVYGGRLVECMLTVRAERAGCRLQGFAVTPEQTRSRRSPQELFVNGRAVKNATVAHAVYDGYAPSLAKGRHPVFVLYLMVDPDRVDVNVHPTKREVRFADQELIHELVRHGIRAALGRNDRAQGGAGPSSELPRLASLASWPRQTQDRQASPGVVLSTPSATARRPVQAEEAPVLFAAHEAGAVYGGLAAESEPDIMPFGQISRTFLVAQVGPELQIVDQHTAHERVLFERLWRSWATQRVPIQPLLLSEPFEVPPDRAALLVEGLPHLAKLGLEIEPFGPGTFLIRGVPAQLGALDYPGLIQDILDDLVGWGSDRSSSLEERLRPVVASLACHGAVRAGRAMELAEITQLLRDWVAEGLPMTCPHGRRIALRFPAEELAKIFGRV